MPVTPALFVSVPVFVKVFAPFEIVMPPGPVTVLPLLTPAPVRLTVPEPLAVTAPLIVNKPEEVKLILAAPVPVVTTPVRPSIAVEGTVKAAESVKDSVFAAPDTVAAKLVTELARPRDTEVALSTAKLVSVMVSLALCWIVPPLNKASVLT